MVHLRAANRRRNRFLFHERCHQAVASLFEVPLGLGIVVSGLPILREQLEYLPLFLLSDAEESLVDRVHVLLE